MGRRGTKPAPTALKVLKGTQPCRINQNEPKPPDGLPEPPAYLEGDALDLWDELAPLLADMGVLTVADRHAFALLCDSYRRWREFENDPKRRDEFRKLLAEFGLTPSSRSSIKVNTKSIDRLGEFLAS